MSNPPPVHELKLGRIRAAVWSQPGDHGPRFSVTVSRLYKDDAGKWADATSFGRDDLLVVAKVADMAHTWVYEQLARERHWEAADCRPPAHW